MNLLREAEQRVTEEFLSAGHVIASVVVAAHDGMPRIDRSRAIRVASLARSAW